MNRYIPDRNGARIDGARLECLVARDTLAITCYSLGEKKKQLQEERYKIDTALTANYCFANLVN